MTAGSPQSLVTLFLRLFGRACIDKYHALSLFPQGGITALGEETNVKQPPPTRLKV